MDQVNKVNERGLISVVVPTCQRDDLLAKCLDCLAHGAQTIPAGRYEVVVTDDGRESTAERMVADRFPWAKWVQGPGRGPAANRNHGVRSSAGRWIVFTDDDCLPKPGWLAAYLESISDGFEVYEGKTICEDIIRSPLYEAPINEKGGFLWSCNMMISRQLFDELGGFDENFPFPAMEDVDLRERVQESGRSFLFVEEAVVNHPVRRKRSGRRMGELHEALVYDLFKHGKRPSLWRTFVAPLTISTVRIAARSKVWYHVPAGLAHAAVEIGVVIFSFRGWVKKHSPNRLVPTAGKSGSQQGPVEGAP